MPSPSAQNVFLPSWRQGRLLFFSSVTDGYTTRLDYRVAAATARGDNQVMRSYKTPISAAELANCQKTADNGPALQQFFATMGRGNLDDLIDDSRQHLPPCASGTNPLIYICSYFNFLRKYSVDQTLVRHYEARSATDRFEAESSLSIYKILSSHLQPERAAALIEADLPDIHKFKSSGPSAANLLREVAIIRHDTGAHAAAIEAMLQAVKQHNTEDKWRRLAGFAIADNQPDQAIGFFAKAEGLAPLAPPPAFRMAKMLVEAGRADEAMPYLARAETAFRKPVETLRAKIASLAEKT